ncbi:MULTISPECIES: hypothetical protein [Emticicia]|uniref:hypothetical protein n=1 Tax=Emticicia TaxID=312278 RepID=UPI0020A08C7A|nr:MULTISPECIES: hypothetical protein [Emticicia]UTA66894.1 hypothetical protein MB380_14920 [Emticicia sp. 21SJ11W-3]
MQNILLQLKKTLLITLGIVLAVSMSSCTKKIAFLNSSVVPAARGYVEIKSDKNKNNVIQIHLTNLAEVQRLQPARQTYIVWMKTDQELTKNMGQIKSSGNMMSKQLKATFETVTSFRPVLVFITAEDDPNTQYAGGQVVLTTNNF